MRNSECRCRKKNLFLTGVVMTTVMFWCISARAEIKVVEADSTYLMGDNDSKVDARRIATQEAKRKALEMAGTYVESLTVVKNYQLSRDEIKNYTAGVLETTIIADEMRGSVEHPEVYIKARCRVDTDAVTAQIDRFRENEDLKEQLDAAAKENNELKQERDQLVKQLAAEKDKTKAEDTRKKLDTVLSREEANDNTKTVWINVGQQIAEVDETGREVNKADLDKSSVVLQQSIKANPDNQQARFLLAAIYEKQGNHGAAENELRDAIRRNPSRPMLHMKLGVLLKAQHRSAQALEEFHIVERTRPRDPMMLFFTGMTFHDLDECKNAIPYLEKFVRESRSMKFPKKRENALQVLKRCGDHRRGPYRLRRD